MDMRKRIAIIFGSDVQPAVVATRPPGPICLWYHVKRRSPRGVRSSNYSHSLHFHEFFLCYFQLLRIQTPWSCMQRSSRCRNVVFHIMTDFPSKVLHQQVGKFLEKGLKRTLRRKTKTRNGRTVCWDSLERIGFGYQTSVADVDEDVIGGKKIGPQDGSAHCSDPEGVKNPVTRSERNFNPPLAESFNRGTVGGHQTR